MNNKDVVYIDVEDEITNIIEKVNNSKSKIIALVLPKRATVFQSIVNMKLLKKKATEANKQVVLITSEPSLLPLAGVVGVHVAQSLQAQPQIPPDPSIKDDNTPVDVDDVAGDKKIDSSKPIGELAGLAAVGAAVAKSNPNEPEDSIEFDNESMVPASGLENIDKKLSGKKLISKKAKGLISKSPKIPNFDKFRNRLLIGLAVLILLIVLWILGFKILPKATIIVQTNTSSINSNLVVTLSQANQNLDPTTDTVPAKFQTILKTSTSTPVNTTGTKTIGTPASGTITVKNVISNTNQYTIPSGTVFTDSSGNFSFTSNTAEVIQGFGGGHNGFSQPSVNIPVTATQVGASYNINATSYTTNDSTLTSDNYQINGSDMTGGSSSNVQAVAQADITSAQSQLPTPSSSQMEQQLQSSLKNAGYIPITQTYVAGNPTYTPSAAVGTQANSITVTENVTYSMYGAKQSDLNTLITNNVNQQINPSTQSILDSGVTTASFSLQSSGGSSAQVTMQTKSTIGPKLNATNIAKQSLGVKSGDIKSSISQIPGVTNVTVKYSPFWVSTTPTNIKKVTVIIEKANGSNP